MKKVRILLLTLTCALLLALGHRAGAETEYLDATRNAETYARAVAAMNVALDERKGMLRASSAEGETVLCRTNGMTLTPETFDGVCPAPELLFAGPNGRYTLRFADARDARAAIDWLNRQPRVIYAEPDAEIFAADIAFDSWGAESMGMAVYLSFAADWGAGGCTVAVLDSGVIAHPFLEGIVVNGYDYVDNDDDPTNDAFDHGTRVAGIVADCTRGAPVTILNLRVLNDVGSGKMSNVINAIQDACDRGVDVINLSMAQRADLPAVNDAVIQAADRGVAVVVSAGNFACDTSEVSPAKVTEAGVIVVGAANRSDGTDTRASYSCYGDSVDVYAYGTGIVACNNSGGYSAKNGTSFSAPHVSAACALMKLLSPGITPEGMEARLKLADDASEGLAVKLSPLVPAEEGFRLADIVMAPGEVLSLPSSALPLTCGEDIAWTLAGDGLSLSADGRLEAVAPGAATLTATCRGFETCVARVTVAEGSDQVLALPGGLVSIGEEAFADSDAAIVDLPGTVTGVGVRAFGDCPRLRLVRVDGTDTAFDPGAFDGSEHALIICHEDSAALQAAKDGGWQYILQE